MLKYIELHDVGPSTFMRVDFAQRLNFLTGDNGLGKTLLMDVAWWSLARQWADQKALPNSQIQSQPRIVFEQWDQKKEETFESRYSFERELWSLPEKRWMIPVSVLYIRADGGICALDPLKGYKPFIFKPDNVWTGLAWGAKQVCNGLIRDWVSWQLRQDAKRENFELLSKALETLSPSDEEKIKTGDPIRTSLKESQEVPTIRMPYGRVPVTHASAGIRRILSIAYMLVWMWSENKEAEKLSRRESSNKFVVLFDEVESHLHPQWQRRLIPALLRVLQDLNPRADIQLVASTHAPLVLASVETMFDNEKDTMVSFDLQNGRVKARNQHWQSYGDVSAWLTSKVFSLGEARSLEAERVINEALKAINQVDVGADMLKSIHHDLRRILKDTDPFWARWLHYAKRKRILQ